MEEREPKGGDQERPFGGEKPGGRDATVGVRESEEEEKKGESSWMVTWAEVT